MVVESALRSQYFGTGTVTSEDVACNIVGSVVKENHDDIAILREYNRLVAKKRGLNDDNWKLFYETMSKTL